VEDVLRSKVFYQNILGKEKEPINDEMKFKWDNKNGEAHGQIGMSISPDLRFHLQEMDDPKKAWKKIEYVFGKHNITRAHQIENQLMNLSPKYFHCIEYYLSKFKTLRILCIN
jgi:hypothetical protein